MTGAEGVTLTTAVEDLADAVEALRSDMARRTWWLWAVLGLVVAGSVAALAFLLVGLSDQQRAGCAFWQDLAAFPVEELQSEFGRLLVADARLAADELGCP